jgi:hypothetical protein
MTSTVWFGPVAAVTLSVPVVLSAAVTPFARFWPATKFSVDVRGLVTGSGVRATKPTYVAFVMVRLPVTATAVFGTLVAGLLGNWFHTWKVYGTWFARGPWAVGIP